MVLDCFFEPANIGLLMEINNPCFLFFLDCLLKLNISKSVIKYYSVICVICVLGVCYEDIAPFFCQVPLLLCNFTKSLILVPK